MRGCLKIDYVVELAPCTDAPPMVVVATTQGATDAVHVPVADNRLEKYFPRVPSTKLAKLTPIRNKRLQLPQVPAASTDSSGWQMYLYN